VRVALLVDEGNTVGLTLGVGVGAGVEDEIEPAPELALDTGAAARLSDAGAAQLAVPNPITMTSRHTTSLL